MTHPILHPILTWQFDPVLLRAGPLTVRWYGLLFVAAFLAGQLILARMLASEGKDPRKVDGTVGQWLSLPFVAVGLALVVHSLRGRSLAPPKT